MTNQQIAEAEPDLFDPRATEGSWPAVLVGHDAQRRSTGYRLHSECLDTGKVTIGQYVFADREIARAVAVSMDVLWPRIRHRAVPADASSGAAGPSAAARPARTE